MWGKNIKRVNVVCIDQSNKQNQTIERGDKNERLTREGREVEVR